MLACGVIKHKLSILFILLVLSSPQRICNFLIQLKNVIRRLTLGTADFEQNNTQYL